MRFPKTTLASLISATIKAFLLGSVVITMTAMSAQADPLDKSSPKIAHGRYKYLSQLSSGMYRDRGKSSPKIAHGMYRDRGKSSPKIAHGMHRVERNELQHEIEMAIETGRLNLADDLLYKLDHLNRAGR
ncbi:MAG: hypothetical protein OSB47_12510 [Pirellulaceae bacterium]|nr:hypothetical protein [Pirellulaceae bacterium]